MVLPEVFLSFLMAATWWYVARRENLDRGWRHTASKAGLILPTVALALELLLAAIVAYYGSLQNLDEAAQHGRAGALVAWSSLGLSIATGLLPVVGLVLGVIGKGGPRVVGIIWSCVVLGTAFVNFVLAVNSFH